jgi:hypothetical protein
MVEIGRRDLPLAAVRKLYKLEMFTLLPMPIPSAATLNFHIEKHRKKLHREKLKMEKKLKQMQAAYTEATNGLAMAKQFLSELPTNRGEELMLQSLEYSSEKELKRNSLEEQEYLRWQIGWIEKMLE